MDVVRVGLSLCSTTRYSYICESSRPCPIHAPFPPQSDAYAKAQRQILATSGARELNSQLKTNKQNTTNIRPFDLVPPIFAGYRTNISVCFFFSSSLGIIR